MGILVDLVRNDSVSELPLCLRGTAANRVPTASVNGDTRSNLAPAPGTHPSCHSLALDRLSYAVSGAGPGPNEGQLQRLNEAIRLDPDSSRLYLKRAEARTALERYAEADDDDQAVRINRDGTSASGDSGERYAIDRGPARGRDDYAGNRVGQTWRFARDNARPNRREPLRLSASPAPSRQIPDTPSRGRAIKPECGKLGALLGPPIRLTAAVEALNSFRARSQIRWIQRQGRLAIQPWISAALKGTVFPPNVSATGKVSGWIQRCILTMQCRGSRSTSYQRRIDATARNLAISHWTMGSLLRIDRVSLQSTGLRAQTESVRMARARVLSGVCVQSHEHRVLLVGVSYYQSQTVALGQVPQVEVALHGFRSAVAQQHADSLDEHVGKQQIDR